MEASHSVSAAPHTATDADCLDTSRHVDNMDTYPTDTIPTDTVPCAVCDAPTSAADRNDCGHCGAMSCHACHAPAYECAGWHRFSEYACQHCRDPFSRATPDTFYCGKCAPPTAGPEYTFKKFIHERYEELLQRYFEVVRVGVSLFPYTITLEYLNDPDNWTKSGTTLQDEVDQMLLGNRTLEDFIHCATIRTYK
jgi:hypothetical protein